jgi:hypothetical protein
MLDELTAVLRVSTDPASPAYAAPVDPKIWLAIKARLSTVEQLPGRTPIHSGGRSATQPGGGRLPRPTHT